MTIKKISLIGAGNVGHYFAHSLFSQGIEIHQIYGRNEEKTKSLANQVNGIPITELKAIDVDADLIIVAVADDAIKTVYQNLSSLSRPIVHTSGATETVQPGGNTFSGVFYPLQTIRKENYVFDRSVPICITASSDEFKSTLMALANRISDKVVSISDRDRLKYHMTAVFANNFVHHLFAKIEDFLEEECLERDLLRALVSKTFEQLSEEDLKSLQTGPAVRNDLITEAKHLSLLNQYGDESLMDIYELFSKSIKGYY